MFETVEVSRLRDGDYVRQLSKHCIRGMLLDESGRPMGIKVYGEHAARKFMEMSDSCHLRRGYFNNSFCMVTDSPVVRALVEERGYFLIGSGKFTYLFEGVLLLSDIDKSIETWKTALAEYAESIDVGTFRRLVEPNEEQPF